MVDTLRPKVAVVTGGSSGIGRATAQELARRGYGVVVAARGEAGLQDAAAEVRRFNVPAAAVPTDVADWQQVRRLAEEAVERYGRIDCWVNNAAVAEYAPLDDMTPEEIRRVVEVDLLGTMYGCKAALGVMRRQNAGVIVNVSSGFGTFGVPFLSTYVAAKHGVKGFTDSLRLELRRANSPVRVTLVLPSSVNTPFFDHARTKLGVRPRPIPPVYQPEVVAAAIADSCDRPAREVTVGGGLAMELLHRLSPALTDWLLLCRDQGARQQLSDQPPPARDNLFQSTGGGQTHGGYDAEALSGSPATRLTQMSPGWQLALAAAGAVGLAALTGAFRGGRA